MAHVADSVMAHQALKSGEPCGWIGVGVRPITAAFAEAVGMAEPYGALFDQPKPGSPAAAADIEQDDVVTAINGSPLMRATDFAAIISSMAPGTTVNLTTWRGGEWFQRTLIVASSKCPDPTARLPTRKMSVTPYGARASRPRKHDSKLGDQECPGPCLS